MTTIELRAVSLRNDEDTIKAALDELRAHMDYLANGGTEAEELCEALLIAQQTMQDALGVEMTFECAMDAPMYGDGVDARDVVERIREQAYPLIVARFENVTVAEAFSRRDEINHELAAMAAPELGELRVVAGGSTT